MAAESDLVENITDVYFGTAQWADAVRLEGFGGFDSASPEGENSNAAYQGALIALRMVRQGMSYFGMGDDEIDNALGGLAELSKES